MVLVPRYSGLTLLKKETYDMLYFPLLPDLITLDLIPIIVICNPCISILWCRFFLFKFS